MALIVALLPIKDGIADLSKQITSVRRKTTTLIDYYIYPEETPSEIDAYDPRLAQLQTRLATLSKISYPNLAYLLDDSDALAASYLNQIIDQVLNAIHGIQEIFQSHYDRHLEERKPFETIYQVLLHRETQLKQYMRMDSRRLLPEELRPNQEGEFCRGAIQMINGRDRGKLSFVDRRDLLEENRKRLNQFGGAFLWWECQECNFRLKYHVSSSVNSNIHSTDEIRAHAGVLAEYKSAFLTKCHMVQQGMGRRSRGSISGRSGAKFGCVFCFANGKRLESGVSAFGTGRDLASHLAEKHRKNLPPSPLLQKFNVAVKDKCAERVRRWEINFL